VNLVHWQLVPNWSWLVLSLYTPPECPGNLTGRAEGPGPPRPGLLLTDVMCIINWEEVVMSPGEWSLSIHRGVVYRSQLRVGSFAYWHQLKVG
jgi:hypothetical protein